MFFALKTIFANNFVLYVSVHAIGMRMVCIGILIIKVMNMRRAFYLICYHLGLWGLLGFIFTLILGFLACCMNLPENLFFTFLGIFALTGITATTICVSRGCKKLE
jgi:hypothetical protein